MFQENDTDLHPNSLSISQHKVFGHVWSWSENWYKFDLRVVLIGIYIWQITVEMSLSTSLRHVGGVEIQLHAVLNSAPYGRVNITTRPLYPLESTPVSIELEAGWSPETVWTFWRREKSLTLAGIQTPKPPVRSPVAILATLSRLP
jgi:hypothetical protein